MNEFIEFKCLIDNRTFNSLEECKQHTQELIRQQDGNSPRQLTVQERRNLFICGSTRLTWL